MLLKKSLTVAIFAILLVSCGSPLVKKDISSCVKIVGVPGPEDLELITLDKKPFLFISVHNRREMESIGWISILDLSLPIDSQIPIALKTNYPPNFRPHGISYANVKGIDTLAVISHTLRETNPHTIEIFERDNKGSWAHVRTLEDSSLTGPNDLVLNESGEIFSTNDHGPENKFMQYVNMIFKNGTGDISYYDGNKFQSLNQPVILGIGIFVRKEGGKEILYRSVFSEGAISVYEIIRANQKVSLTFIKKIQLSSGPDNIIQDEDGSLWVAGHPSTWKFLRHASSKENLAPTQVFRIDGKTHEVKNIYSNEGDQISAGSTALPFNGRLYISQVYEDFLLSCSKP